MAALNNTGAGSADVLAFRRPRRICRGCGQHLSHSHQGDVCGTCIAWNTIAQATAIRRRALGAIGQVGDAQ